MQNKIDKEFEKIEREVQKKHDDDGRKNPTTSELLIELVEGNESIELFHTDIKDMFARIFVDGHFEVWKIRSKQFKQWMVKQFWENHEKAPNANALNEALNVIESMARFNGKQYTLSNRVASVSDVLWYDLADIGWRAVRVTADGWEVVEEPPILFRRYHHQLAQVEPLRGGDIKSILKYVNVSKPEQQLLFLVYLVSCFIPGFPHPIPIIYGSQGSAKSSFSRVLRTLVDPSAIEVSELPKNHAELVQKLAHHWCIVFDNVSYVSDEVSDLLCRAVSGTGFSKRELYTDDEDIILVLKHCVALNGINLVATRPDLLERSILFEFERIPEEKRRQERELFAEMHQELPLILGSIFDVLSRAMRIHPTVNPDKLPRMADFAVWGCAIAEGMGYTRDEFLNAYYGNIEIQNEEVINENVIASILIELMRDKDEWSGTPRELYAVVRDIAAFTFHVNPDRDTAFPKAENAFTRKLNYLKQNLEKEGIYIERKNGRQRRVLIRKQETSEDTAETASLSQEEPIDNF